MRITCPHCGPRTSEEFSYLGDATKQRPEGTLQGTIDVKLWNDYVHLRANPHGTHRELWQHGPCRTWLVVTRDVTTHQIFEVESAGKVKS